MREWPHELTTKKQGEQQKSEHLTTFRTIDGVYGVAVDKRKGGVLNMVIDNLYRNTEFIAINEQTNRDIMHLYGFREADRFAH